MPKMSRHSSIPPLSDALWGIRFESWEDPFEEVCAKSSDFTRDQNKLVPWCESNRRNKRILEIELSKGVPVSFSPTRLIIFFLNADWLER